jgi:hypothetical protein
LSLPLLSLRTATITNYLQFRLSPGVRAPRAPKKKKKKKKIPFKPARQPVRGGVAASRTRARARALACRGLTKRRRSETLSSIVDLLVASDSHLQESMKQSLRRRNEK